jgi:hypothetical protein|tara:strand:- start:1086 stop:2447 length:1362 start_codon:yes stop_codon:yes gene_type:complete
MASALDKVTNFMLPDLAGNNMANLLGIDTVRKARGRALLDAGLTGMALAGPRPATDNVNSAMIMKQMFDQGYNTYDNAINRELTNLQTNMALQENIQSKKTFNSLIASDYVSDDEKAFALTLGPEKGAEFLADVYMTNVKNGQKFLDVVRISDNKSMRITQSEYINNIDQYSTDSKTAIEKKLDLAGITDPEERKKYIIADLQGQTITIGADGSVTIGKNIGSSGMEKKTTGNLEQQIINSSLNFEAFKDIASAYKPEFSQLPTKTKVWWTKIKDGLGDWNLFGDISEEDKQLVREYTAWEQKSYEAVNKYIKSITGAQMSEKEAERIMKGFADVRDLSPEQYMTKLEGILDNAQKSVIRNNLILMSGLDVPTMTITKDGVTQEVPNPEAIMTLASVNTYVNQIGDEIRAELKASEDWEFKSDEEINNEVKRQLQLLLFGDTSKNVFTLENLR